MLHISATPEKLRQAAEELDLRKPDQKVNNLFFNILFILSTILLSI